MEEHRAFRGVRLVDVALQLPGVHDRFLYLRSSGGMEGAFFTPQTESAFRPCHSEASVLREPVS